MVFQPVGHLCQQFLRAGGNMLRPETSNGSVIRSRFPLEKVHEIDIAAAGTFNTPRAVDTIHPFHPQSGVADGPGHPLEFEVQNLRKGRVENFRRGMYNLLVKFDFAYLYFTPVAKDF